MGNMDHLINKVVKLNQRAAATLCCTGCAPLKLKAAREVKISALFLIFKKKERENIYFFFFLG